MSVSGLPIDLYPFLQFIFTAFLIAIGIIHLVKSTASKYFVVDDTNFEEGERERERRRERERGEVAFQNNCQKNRNQMVAVANTGDGSCAFCGKLGIKQCSSCKAVKYCSGGCQSEHWKAGHKKKCRELKLFRAIDATPSVTSCGEKDSVCDINSSKGLPRLKKVLFPYEDFVKLFNWEKMVFFPCGLLNCGNSCYANVVLQCLSCTRPLIAHLMEVGHKKKCRRNDWCFLCELEVHVVRARFSRQPFSPMNILSRLPNIGANLGYGKQEDAHEFMRFAIDTMQSVCLDEFGGEKALHPSSQETTLIQYIFGGHLQSQVKCSECNKISYRHENMMDLTVEIQGDAESLEECLDQFTAEELLDGENMYKCEGCNDYVKASKRLAIHHAPNILTIALKRFQSGRFGKLNKRVAFPETLDLGPYMTEPRHGTDLYRLYAVVVHVDMLNASYFGHYICYTKDSYGNWHRIDDCRVTIVDLEEVLAQGAYMLLYSRTCVRPSFVKPLESFKEEKQALAEEAQPCSQESVDSEGSIESFSTVASLSADVRSHEEEEMEAQPCFQFPVEGSLKIMPSDVRSSTPEPSSEKNDLVCMNLDESVEVNSRFGRAIMTDVPIDDVKSNSLDMEVDSDSASSVCMQLDDSDNKQSNSTDICSSLEDINGGLLTKAPLTEAIQPGETHDLNFEVSGTTSNKQIFEDGYKVCNKEPILSEGSVDNSLPSQSDIHELAETTCSLPSSGLNSVSSNLQEGSSSSFCSTQKLKLKQDTPLESFSGSPAARITKGHNSRLVGYKSCSNRKQRPVFYPGFLDKRLRKSEQCLNGAEQYTPGFLDKQSRGKFHNRNDAPVGLGEVGSSCKVNNCNGSTNPGSLLQNGSEANNYDRNLGCTNVLKSAKVIENNAEKIFIGKDERVGRALGEGGDSCNNINENKACNLNQTQGTYWGNGKDVFSPGFLNRPSRKNSLKKNCENTSMDEDARIGNILREACDSPQSHCNGNDNGFCFDENRICDKNQRREMCCGNDNDISSPGIRRKNNSLINDEEGTSLREAVSSNYDRSKFPRVG